MNASLKNATPVMTLKNVFKSFGGVIAAEDVNLEFYGGEILGLIGPNGAGKSTLINLITGIYAADKGEISFKGRDITRMSTHNRARLGIARTFQHPRLLNRCSVYDNIMLGVDLARCEGRRSDRSHPDKLPEILKAAGLDQLNLHGSITKLSYGQQKLLEIVRAILSEPEVLLLDEPAAGLNSREMEYIVNLMNLEVKRNIPVLLIEHSMDLVMSVCDRITVLNFGHQIATGTPEEIQDNQAVIDAYLGGSENAED